MLASNMQTKAQRLRIYIGESDRWRGKPLDAALLETLRAAGVAGATVLRGTAGFGAHSRIHTASIEVLSFDLPVVIEVIDTPAKISAALEAITPMVREGLITREEVEVIKYTHRYLNPLPADRLVAEVMTPAVVSVTPDTTVYAAWSRMLAEKVKALPVVGAAGQVLGMLTDADLLERAGVQQRLSVAVRLDPAELAAELERLKQLPVAVGEVMSHPAVTARADETLGHAVARMVRSGLKRLPVVDAQERLVGMLSRLDVLRQVAGPRPAESPAPAPAQAARTVGEVMSARLPSVRLEDDLPALIAAFLASGSHRLVVIDSGGRPVGLVSDSDVVARVQPDQRPRILQALRRLASAPRGGATAAELMSQGVLSAPASLSVADAARLMLAEGRKWLVVSDEQGRPLGLVDRQILLEALLSF